MARLRCAVSFSLAAVAVAQLLYNPVGHAQTAPAGEPEVNVQDSNVAPAPQAYPPPAPAYPPPPGYAPAPVAGPIVTLRANTPRARLQMQGAQLQWMDVCTTPCNVAVHPAGVYRIGGNTILPSDSFNMPRLSGPVFLEVQYGSKIKRWVGIGMIIAGVVNGLTGLYYYGNANDLATSPGGNGEPDLYKGVGIFTILVGVVLAGIGIPLSLSSTSVEVR